MVEISRDGKRVYWTNSLYSTWDAQFYPGGVEGAMVKADVGPDGGLPSTRPSGSSSRTASPAPDPPRRRRLLDESFCYPSV